MPITEQPKIVAKVLCNTAGAPHLERQRDRSAQGGIRPIRPRHLANLICAQQRLEVAATLYIPNSAY